MYPIQSYSSNLIINLKVLCLIFFSIFYFRFEGSANVVHESILPSASSFHKVTIWNLLVVRNITIQNFTIKLYLLVQLDIVTLFLKPCKILLFSKLNHFLLNLGDIYTHTSVLFLRLCQ